MHAGCPGVLGHPHSPRTPRQAPRNWSFVTPPCPQPPATRHLAHHTTPTQLPNDHGARGCTRYCVMALNYTWIRCSAQLAIVGGESGPPHVVPQRFMFVRPPPVPTRCQHVHGGLGNVRQGPRSLLAAWGPCPCVVAGHKNARMCLGSAG